MIDERHPFLALLAVVLSIVGFIVMAICIIVYLMGNVNLVIAVAGAGNGLFLTVAGLSAKVLREMEQNQRLLIASLNKIRP